MYSFPTGPSEATPTPSRPVIPFAAPVVTPIVITAPGSYVVTQNLAPTGPGPLITIALPAASAVDVAAARPVAASATAARAEVNNEARRSITSPPQVCIVIVLVPVAA